LAAFETIKVGEFWKTVNISTVFSDSIH